VNLLLLKPDDFVGDNLAEISGRRFQHLKKIRKVIEGQALCAGMLNGKTGTAIVRSISRDSIQLSTQLINEAPAPVDCSVILALPRPLMLKRILQSLASLGIKDIHLIQTRAVEKSYWSSSDLEENTLDEQLVLGLEQGMDTLLPRLSLHRHFPTFCRDTLPGLSANRECLLAHPGENPPCPANITKPITLAVGPEGGFTENEVSALTDHGFHKVQMGQRILRVETAVVALLGRVLPQQH
jgi:16S rRNA (uracil1498-N3)-methyltransferase